MAASNSSGNNRARAVGRWFTAFLAPAIGAPGAPAWQRIWPTVAHCAGLFLALWAILGHGLFLPAVLLAWLCYQGLLATHVVASSPPFGGLTRLLLAMTIPVAVVVLVTQVRLVEIAGDCGLPEVDDGDWLWVESLPPDALPGLGQSIVVTCPDDLFTVARVVGLPGDRLFLDGPRVCRNHECLPVAPLLEEDWAGELTLLQTEVVGSQAHLLLPAQGGATDSWRTALPVEVPTQRVAVLPDNRGSYRFGQCTGGVIVLPRERVAGLAGTVVWARNWSRLGLTIR
jgi:hypothetical protein